MERLRLKQSSQGKDRRFDFGLSPDLHTGIPALFALLVLFSLGCGTSKTSQGGNNNGPIAANWQFNLAAPSDSSFFGIASPSCPSTSGTSAPLCLGGFLQQSNNSVNGQLTYLITTPEILSNAGFACSGSASVSGSINGNSVNLTVQAGPQTLSLTGTLSADGSTMMGTYSSIDAPGCGTAQSGLQWKAATVAPLSGVVQGNLHSMAPPNHFAKPDFPTGQDFPFTGTLSQSPNIGASNATVTGSISFPNGYPCLGKVASVNGQISGSSVILQIIAGNGLNAGQIGKQLTSSQPQPGPVAFRSTSGGWVLTGENGYGVSSKQCPPGNAPGDYGNICLAMGNSTACTQPVLLSPSALTFPQQVLGSPAISQTITLTNTDPSGASLSGLTLVFNPQSGQQQTQFQGKSDFSGTPNFEETDNCAPVSGAPFTLASQQSCTITISYSPQESCPWIPFAASGDPPASPTGAVLSSCPYAFPATLTVNSPRSADGVSTGPSSFTVPINGTGLSAIVPYNPFDPLNPTVAPGTFELDFGAEAVGETSTPQTLTFTNQSAAPVQILPALSTPCQIGPKNAVPFTLPRPSVAGSVAGLQVVANGNGGLSVVAAPIGTSSSNTVQYACDSDPLSKAPNFQIVHGSDHCSGTTLLPRQSCSVDIAFAPQPGTPLNSGLDYFLELNTLQCSGSTTTGCEIDSGRFPVELKANIASPLRMKPGADLYFPTQIVGETSSPMTITLFNDPNDPNAGTVNLTGNITKGNFLETDNCGGSLAPGSSCTLSIMFTPQSTGLNQGTVTVGYSIGNLFGQTQTIYLRGMGQ